MKGCPSVHSEHVVRVNDAESGLLPLDLEAVFKSCDPASWSHDLSHDPRGVMPDALLLPKVETTEQLQEVRISHVPGPLPPLSSSSPSPTSLPSFLFPLARSSSGLPQELHCPSSSSHHPHRNTTQPAQLERDVCVWNRTVSSLPPECPRVWVGRLPG